MILRMPEVWHNPAGIPTCPAGPEGRTALGAVPVPRLGAQGHKGVLARIARPEDLRRAMNVLLKGPNGVDETMLACAGVALGSAAHQRVARELCAEPASLVEQDGRLRCVDRNADAECIGASEVRAAESVLFVASATQQQHAHRTPPPRTMDGWHGDAGHSPRAYRTRTTPPPVRGTPTIRTDGTAFEAAAFRTQTGLYTLVGSPSGSPASIQVRAWICEEQPVSTATTAHYGTPGYGYADDPPTPCYK